MTSADIPAVAAIDRLSFPTPWPTSSYIYELSRNSRSFYFVLLRPSMSDIEDQQGLKGWFRGLLGAGGDSRVIGYVGLRLETGGTHISTLAVHPDWRGRGLGELLLLRAITKTMELGFDTITLEVRASNQVAQHLYTKYRFRFDGLHRGYYRDGEDAWLMRADLDERGYKARFDELRAALEDRLESQAEGLEQNGGS